MRHTSFLCRLTSEIHIALIISNRLISILVRSSEHYHPLRIQIMNKSINTLQVKEESWRSPVLPECISRSSIPAYLYLSTNTSNISQVTSLRILSC